MHAGVDGRRAPARSWDFPDGAAHPFPPSFFLLQQDVFSLAGLCSRKAAVTASPDEGLGTGGGDEHLRAKAHPALDVPVPDTAREGSLVYRFNDQIRADASNPPEKSLTLALPCSHPAPGPPPCPTAARAAAAQRRFPCQGSPFGVAEARRICMLWLNPAGHGEAAAGPRPEARGGCARLFPAEPGALSFQRGKTNNGWKTTVATPRRRRNRLEFASPGRQTRPAVGRTLLHKR